LPFSVAQKMAPTPFFLMLLILGTLVVVVVIYNGCLWMAVREYARLLDDEAWLRIQCKEPTFARRMRYYYHDKNVCDHTKDDDASFLAFPPILWNHCKPYPIVLLPAAVMVLFFFFSVVWSQGKRLLLSQPQLPFLATARRKRHACPTWLLA
jgi:hypothetical protein